uniref:uncharacterized protein LOC125907537 isoform X1 n=1 Tax=Anopheles coluzzii TaxID=1518534 RepID=UPI0020FFE9C0|nr:uncharacterized protein LOC125907537 isoform X1 [Anopheles coluzzii]
MNRGEFPKLKTTLEFLCRQCEVLDQCASERGERGDKGKMVSAKVYTASIQNCKLCNDDQHNIVHCPEFLALSTRERQIKAQELRLCYNCLGAGRSSRRCESRRTCRRCNKHHHTLLHFEQSIEMPSSEHVATASHQEEETSGTGSPSSSSPSSPQIVLSVQGAAKSTVLLSTVLLNIVDDQGTNHQARALLDSGAQSNFISGRLVQLLRLPRKIVNIPLSGIGGSSTINVRHSVRATIRSRCSEDAFTLDMLVLATPSASLPTQPVDISSWNIPEDYILADPTFNQPGRVDIILGAELFYEFLKELRVSFGLHRPVLQESKFGWIVSGNALIEPASDPVVCATALITDNLSMVAAEDNAEMSLSHHPVISNAVIRYRSDLQSGLRTGVIEIQNDELRVGRAKREGASVADVIYPKSSERAAETSTSDSTAVCLGGSDFGGIISATGIPRNHDWELWARLGTSL